MKLASVIAALTLAFSLAAPVYAADMSNVALEVGASDLYATVPLCTYWYAQGENQGITPVMTVTNNGFTPIAVSGARFPNSKAAIRGIPCTLMQSGQMDFVLTENPQETAILKQAVKHAVIFTISKIGE